MVEKVKSLKDRLLEVELGFDKKRGHTEARRCLNCDVQTVFIAATCIECDACVDICPVTCINFIANGDEEDLRPRLLIPADNLAAGPLCLAGPAHRPGHGQGRKRLPALRPLRRTLSDRVMGDARNSPTMQPRLENHEQDRTRQRFRRPLCQCQRHRLGQRQQPLCPGDLPHGGAGQPEEHLPLEYPGPADLV